MIIKQEYGRDKILKWISKTVIIYKWHDYVNRRPKIPLELLSELARSI